MKKKTIKKIVLWTLASVLILFLVLCVHIYVAMKPKAPGVHTVAMARIDFKQNITPADAEKIAAWLYQQPGVAHVVCNPSGKMALFTFYPVKANASDIAGRLTGNMHYNAKRYIPTEQEMAGGCPVAGTSFSYKVYSFMSKIL